MTPKFKLSLLTAAAWLPRVLLAAVFTATGLAKLTAQPMMVGMFERIGLGQGFRVATALVELAAAVLILWPRTMMIGAFAMLAVLAGALVVQIGIVHGDMVHVLVIAAFVLLAIWLRGRQVAGQAV